ncbi:MAG: sulfatase-like hydrolase/transferase [Myxococcota bacterium]
MTAPALERRGFLDDAIVVVTSDHGEEFHEHGALLHGATLFEAGVRVPLILIAPRVARGRKVDVPVSLVDVSATILDLVGVPRPTQFEGASLLPLSGVQAEKTGGAERGPVLFDLPPKGGFDVRVHEWGGVDGDEKLLIERDGTGVVLDLARDPGESAPRSTVDDARGAELSRRLARRRAQLARSAGPEARRTALDAETRKQLEALGYAVDESGD